MKWADRTTQNTNLTWARDLAEVEPKISWSVYDSEFHYVTVTEWGLAEDQV